MPTKPLDTARAEESFHRLFAWIQAGHVASTTSGEPYRWVRSGYTAVHMRTSPAGEFLHVTGNGTFAYLRPAAQGYGHMRRLDLRLGTSIEKLEAAAGRTSTP